MGDVDLEKKTRSAIVRSRRIFFDVLDGSLSKKGRGVIIFMIRRLIDLPLVVRPLMSWSLFILVHQQFVLVSTSSRGPQKLMSADSGTMVDRQLNLLEALKIIYLRSIATKVLLEVLGFVRALSVRRLIRALSSKRNY